jgi:hypothetical protein
MATLFTAAHRLQRCPGDLTRRQARIGHAVLRCRVGKFRLFPRAGFGRVILDALR